MKNNWIRTTVLLILLLMLVSSAMGSVDVEKSAELNLPDTSDIHLVAVLAASQPEAWFPFDGTWSFSGPPHNNGESIDFAPWDPSTKWVRADTNVRVITDSNNDCIFLDYDTDGNLNTGWVTYYCHVVDLQVKDLQRVSRGAILAKPYYLDCSQDPCERKDHVHFGFIYDGVYQPIDGKILCGWKVHATGGDYKGYLEKGGKRIEKNEPVESCCGTRLDFQVHLYHPNRTNHGAPIMIKIREVGTNRLLLEREVTTDSNGYGGLALPGIATGDYDVIVKAPVSLSKRASNVHFVSGITTFVDFTNGGATYLIGGDVYYNDDIANAFDLSRILSNWGCTTCTEIDMIDNGKIDGWELAIVLANWKSVGDDFANMQERASQTTVAQASTGSGSLELSPNSGRYKVGQEFNVKIDINTGGKTVDGIDAILRYDPCALEVLNISDGTAFSEYPEKAAYPELGEIGISGKGSFNGSGTIATVRFRVIAGNIYSGLQIYFRPTDTTDSNMAESGSSEEILGSVDSALFVLAGTPSRPPLSGALIPSDSDYLTQFDIPVTLDLSGTCGTIAEEVSFDVYYDSAWHSLGVDRNRYNSWSVLWSTATTDQIVSLKAIVSDTNWSSTTFLAQNLTLDRIGPMSTITVPTLISGTGWRISFNVEWNGSDNLSGVASYDVQYKDGADGAWIEWQSKTTMTSAIFVAEPEHSYYFRVRAHDVAGNTGAFSEEGVVLVNPSKVYLPLVVRSDTS